MKNTLFIILLAYSIIQTKAQSNLVLNPSFEKFIDTSNSNFQGYGAFRNNLVSYWSDPTYFTSDLFTPNSWLNSTSPPILDIGAFQYPKSGSCFAGGIAFSKGLPFREFIQNSFKDPLHNNCFYAIKYYLSLSDYSRCFTDFGFYFSNDLIDTSLIGGYIYFTKPNVIPQYENPNTNWINTFEGWQEMKGIYRATGGERYVSIGNFTQDTVTNSIICTSISLSPEDGAYYFIDDVAIYDTSIIDTIKLCMNDSVEINHRWYKPSSSIINEPFDSGVVVRHYIESLPNSTSFTEIDVPYHRGDTVQAGFVWVCHSSISQTPSFVCDSFDTGMTGCYRFRYLWPTPDTFVDAYFQNIFGCDSTVRYHVRTNVGIDEHTKLLNINLYPNPTSERIHVEYDKNKKLFYTLYDISGKKVLDKNILTPTIDVYSLNKGMYILEIKDEEGNSIRKKIVKE